MLFKVKNTTREDVPYILKLYQTVARDSGGIIRTEEELTLGYIEEVVSKSMRWGIGLMIYHPDNPQEAIAEIHTYPYGLAAFRHILTDLTVVVHPSFQGQKLGKLIFEQLLITVAQQMPHILRVELFVRENNLNAIEFYKKLGFTEEGRHKDKIKNKDNSLETPLEMTWFNPQYKY